MVLRSESGMIHHLTPAEATARLRSNLVRFKFPPAEMTMDELISLVTLRISDEAVGNLLFDEGDHFQGGDSWTGPDADPDDPENEAALDKVEREFASKGALRKVTNTHRDGVISRDPQFGFLPRRPMKKDEKPNAQEQPLIDEAEAALTEDWNESRALKTWQSSTKRLLLAGRAALRIYVPTTDLIEVAEGETVEVEAIPLAPLRVPPGDVAAQLKRIYLLECPYEQATVVRDSVSMRVVGVYHQMDTEDETTVEVSFLDPVDNFTVIRTLKRKGASGVVTESSFKVDLGGRLTIYEMEREAFITPQMTQGQKQLNKGKTLRGHTLSIAGFPETNLLNAAIPGTFEDDPARPGKEVFVADPIKRGPSYINSWAGLSYKDKEGNEHIVSPSIEKSDPAPVNTFIESERADNRDILEEADQLHTEMSGDAASSALSRIQARAGFEMSILPTKAELDRAIAWALETQLKMASTFAGEPDKFDGLRANVDCRIDTGPITPDEQRVGIELVTAKAWSRARLQRFTGVEDTDAEDIEIAADIKKFAPDPIQTPIMPVDSQGNGRNPRAAEMPGQQQPADEGVIA